MASFQKNPGLRTPFGSNEFLRSTVGLKHESYTCAKDSVTAEDHDGTDMKVLQGGEVMARITSGDDAGKVGPFQDGATDGRQDTDNIVGINDTFLPWELQERDANIAVVYDATVVQAWCFERDSSGARIPLGDTTRDAILAQPNISITFQ